MTIHRSVDRFSGSARHRARALRVQDMDEVSSIDLDSALTEEDSTGAGPAAGGGADTAADSEARLRRGLHRATATNAGLSAVVLLGRSTS